MAHIAEFFGRRVDANQPMDPEEHKSIVLDLKTGLCPFIGDTCDVSSNRSDLAFFNTFHTSLTAQDRSDMLAHYGDAKIPSGVCSLSVKRQNEKTHRPWIVCPRRMLDLKTGFSPLPKEIGELIPLPSGTHAHIWWEVKFRDKLLNSQDFFEYTFDYLIMPYKVDRNGNFNHYDGAPFNIEVMTSSTRGGGLTEHMTDVLLGRPQRRLTGGAVKSPYTPNYRQVFGRMISQLFAKSEILEIWGGRSFWLVQDVLVDYIRQTTAFRPESFRGSTAGNVFLLVYTMREVAGSFQLEFVETLRGHARPKKGATPDFTPMLGIGHIPELSSLRGMLTNSLALQKSKPDRNWRKIML